MRKFSFSIALILVLVQIALAGNPGDKKKFPKQPKNIILLIGDGMGTAQVYAGYTAKKGIMNITGMPVSGFSVTYSADDYITDSGAGGTALSTGVKTNNGSIGVASRLRPSLKKPKKEDYLQDSFLLLQLLMLPLHHL